MQITRKFAHLTASEPLNVLRQSHGCKIPVSAVSSKRQYWWDYKLMEMCSFWSPALLSRCDPFANDPILQFPQITNQSISVSTNFLFTVSGWDNVHRWFIPCNFWLPDTWWLVLGSFGNPRELPFEHFGIFRLKESTSAILFNHTIKSTLTSQPYIVDSLMTVGNRQHMLLGEGRPIFPRKILGVVAFFKKNSIIFPFPLGKFLPHYTHATLLIERIIIKFLNL